MRALPTFTAEGPPSSASGPPYMTVTGTGPLLPTAPVSLRVSARLQQHLTPAIADEPSWGYLHLAANDVTVTDGGAIVEVGPDETVGVALGRLGHALVGAKLWRNWPDTGGWYLAEVTDFNPDTLQHCITYERGTEEESFEWVGLWDLGPQEVSQHAPAAAINRVQDKAPRSRTPLSSNQAPSNMRFKYPATTPSPEPRAIGPSQFADKPMTALLLAAQLLESAETPPPSYQADEDLTDVGEGDKAMDAADSYPRVDQPSLQPVTHHPGVQPDTLQLDTLDASCPSIDRSNIQSVLSDPSCPVGVEQTSQPPAIDNSYAMGDQSNYGQFLLNSLSPPPALAAIPQMVQVLAAVPAVDGSDAGPSSMVVGVNPLEVLAAVLSSGSPPEDLKAWVDCLAARMTVTNLQQAASTAAVEPLEEYAMNPSNFGEAIPVDSLDPPTGANVEAIFSSPSAYQAVMPSSSGSKLRTFSSMLTEDWDSDSPTGQLQLTQSYGDDAAALAPAPAANLDEAGAIVTEGQPEHTGLEPTSSVACRVGMQQAPESSQPADVVMAAIEGGPGHQDNPLHTPSMNTALLPSVVPSGPPDSPPSTSRLVTDVQCTGEPTTIPVCLGGGALREALVAEEGVAGQDPTSCLEHAGAGAGPSGDPLLHEARPLLNEGEPSAPCLSNSPASGPGSPMLAVDTPPDHPS